MILVVIPTLSLDQGKATGHRAQISAACDTRLLVIHDEKRQGFTKTANRGLRQRNPGEDVCLLNDDVRTFNYGWLKILATVLRASPGGGIVGPSGQSAGVARHGKLGDFGISKIEMLPFWCALISHELLDSMGHLNEKLIHYSSDTLYCYEARRKGWRVEWVKSVFLWHDHQGSGLQEAWRAADTKMFRGLW